MLANDIPTDSPIRLGSFQFDSSGAGSSTFTFGDRGPGAGTPNASWITGTGTELDELIFGANIPAPFSIIAMGSLLAVCRRRRHDMSFVFHFGTD